MTIISPSILAADFLNLEKEIKSFNNLKNLSFHLDVMDGHYVPNLTFGKTVLKGLQGITNHKLDVHFMVTNPESYIDQFRDLGIHNFSFHWESITHHDNFIDEVKKYYPSVGIALNPGTAVEIIPDYILEKIDLILVMSVNPGFGGQAFIKESISRVQYFANKRKEKNLSFQIQVDGGVNSDNAKVLISAGANNLVAGSYIFKNDNYLEAVASLREQE
jgi:ribulose-phosphate 3-epimerase